VAILPWPTAIMAEYLRSGTDSHAAAAVYSMVMMLHSFCFQAIWWHLTRTGHLFDRRVDLPAARVLRKRFAVGSMVYPLAFGLSFISALVTLTVLGVMAVYDAVARPAASRSRSADRTARRRSARWNWSSPRTTAQPGNQQR